MENLKYEVHQLKRNIDALVERMKKIQGENDSLKKDLVSALDEQEELRKKNKDLENKNLNLQLTQSFGNGKSENIELKQRVEELIREVDECIADLTGKNEEAA
jgi:uncharacterized coiled-coil DUF342 family protein